jgi:hypothetical protein
MSPNPFFLPNRIALLRFFLQEVVALGIQRNIWRDHYVWFGLYIDAAEFRLHIVLQPRKPFCHPGTIYFKVKFTIFLTLLRTEQRFEVLTTARLPTATFNDATSDHVSAVLSTLWSMCYIDARPLLFGIHVDARLV